MIYLASPYSHPDPTIRQDRYETVCRVAGQLIAAGAVLYAPITQTHGMARYSLYAKDHALDWQFWKRQDEWFLRHAANLYVLTLHGWRESVGVTAEIALALTLGIPTSLLSEERDTLVLDTFPTQEPCSHV